MNLRENINILLNEGKQVGTLYHFTSLSGLYGILKTGYININEDGFVSTTRDKNLNTSEFDSEYEEPNYVSIYLDGNKISQNYKISPFSFGYMGKENKEFEEIIHTSKKGLPVYNYIIGIRFGIDDESDYEYKRYYDKLINISISKNITIIES
jgi:hypothetical protein